MAREQGGPCPGCHVKDRRRKRPVAHVPLDRPLIVTPVEIRLDHPECIPPRAPAPFIVERWGMTEVAARWALKAAMTRTFTSVETALGVTPGKVSALYHAVEPQIAAFVPPAPPRCLGLDGVHLLKKTFTMVAVLDRGGNWVFDLLDTHKPERVEARLKEIRVNAKTGGRSRCQTRGNLRLSGVRST
ncbi:MAG: hypothetical protein HY985_10710 [Magnetospirillum sp.]|nr:hypothetical protein [Magnetospirillum sp.]